MNKKGEANKFASVLLGVLIFVALLGVVSSLLRSTEQYDCFNDDFPHLNNSDNLCYNATTGDFSTEASTQIGFNAVELTLAGLIIVLLIIGIIISVKNQK